MSIFKIRRAEQSDNQQILALIRETPQHGNMVLSFEREPDYFRGARVATEHPEIWVAESPDGMIAALLSIGSRRIYINGKPVLRRYAHDFRIVPRFRGRRLLHDMNRTLACTLGPNEWVQTVILNDNRRSFDTLAAGRAGLPHYYPYGTIVTSILPVKPRLRWREPQGLDIRCATAADIPIMQRFLQTYAPHRQFFPCYDLYQLLAGDASYSGLVISDFILVHEAERLVGLAGLWDQSSFKQTRVVALPSGYAFWRPVYNVMARSTGRLQLPAPGERLRFIALHAVLVEDDRADVLSVLVDSARHAALDRNASALICGCFAEDPFAKVLAAHPRRVLSSQHFLASYGTDPRIELDDSMPFVDVARL